MVRHLLSMSKAMGSIPSAAKTGSNCKAVKTSEVGETYKLQPYKLQPYKLQAVGPQRKQRSSRRWGHENSQG